MHTFLGRMNLAIKIGRDHIFEKNQKIDHTCIRSIIWYWKLKIHILKMFLRPNHNQKKIWSKFDFLIFSIFGGHQSFPGVTNNSILGVTNQPLGVTKNSILGVTNQPLGVTKKKSGGHQWGSPKKTWSRARDARKILRVRVARVHYVHV